MPKIEDRGVQRMIVGYSLRHPGDTSNMCNPSTGWVHVTLDILWLHCMLLPRPMYLPDIIVTLVIKDSPI